MVDFKRLSERNSRRDALAAQLDELDDLYYNGGVSTVSDSEYDKLKEEFLALGGTRDKVGAPPDASVVKLARPMLSLAKIHSLAEFLRWWESVGFADLRGEGKLDGASATVTYHAGKFVSGATRGDGEIGQNITAQCALLDTVPKDLGNDFTGEIRGEMVISRADLEAMNRERAAAGEAPFANCRNTAAGAFQASDPSTPAQRRVKFAPYQVLPHRDVTRWATDESILGLSVWTLTAQRASLGVSIQRASLSSALERVLQDMLDGFQAFLDIGAYDLDGCVFKLASIARREELGAGSSAPKWAVAYKFPPPTAITLLEDIVLTIGRTGIVTPNAKLRPVRLSGTTVSAASLCNAEEVARLDVYPGEEVVVQKSGEIIPKVIRRAGEARYGREMWTMPPTFTDSSGRMHRIVKTAGLVAHRLENPQLCVDVRHAQLVHALGVDCLDWDGAGEVLARQLLSVCSDISDVFTLRAETVFQGAKLARFNAAREEAKKQPLWRFIHAVATEGLGRTKSKELAHAAGTVEGLALLPPDKIEAILGPARAALWAESSKPILDTLRRLQAAGCMPTVAAQGPRPLAGKTFCITGAMAVSRPELEARIESLGGTCKSSVTKKVDYLICGQMPGDTKLAAAEKNKKPIITIEEFEELVIQLSSEAAKTETNQTSHVSNP